MSEAGYTLAEMLVALVIVCGTAAAFTGGVGALGRIQADAGASLGREREQARTQQALGGFLEGRGPFGTGANEAVLNGDATRLDFGCGAARCRAALGADGDVWSLELDDGSGRETRIPLPPGGESRFRYGDGQGWLAAWPPKQDGRKLRSVSIISDAGPVAVAELALQQRADCEFDPIVRACRRSADGGR